MESDERCLLNVFIGCNNFSDCSWRQPREQRSHPLSNVRDLVYCFPQCNKSHARCSWAGSCNIRAFLLNRTKLHQIVGKNMYITKHPGGKTVDQPKMAIFLQKMFDFLNLRNKADINLIFISCYAKTVTFNKWYAKVFWQKKPSVMFGNMSSYANFCNPQTPQKFFIYSSFIVKKFDTQHLHMFTNHD